MGSKEEVKERRKRLSMRRLERLRSVKELETARARF